MKVKVYAAIISYTDEQGFEEEVTTAIKTIPFVNDGDAKFEIIGKTIFDQKLSISKTQEDPDGTGELSYQWQTWIKKAWTDISTESTYKIKAADEGKNIRSIISYTDDQGFDEEIITDLLFIEIKNNGSAEFKLNEEINSAKYSLDVDGDGRVTALGDGLMIIRKLFGVLLMGDKLTEKAMSNNATKDNQGIHEYIQAGIDDKIFDVDGDGKVTALGDGLMIIRKLFGSAFDGDKLTEKAMSNNASRSVEEIHEYIENIGEINSLFPKFEIGLISEDPDGTGELTYQWQSSTDKKTWDDISTESAYSVQADDEGKILEALLVIQMNRALMKNMLHCN